MATILLVITHREIAPIVDNDELRKHNVAETIKIIEEAYDQEMRLENGE